MWALLSYTAHTARFCPSRSCTSTWLRRARLARASVQNRATENASLLSARRSGCIPSLACTTVSRPAALFGSAPEDWWLSLTRLKRTQQKNKCTTQTHLFLRDRKLGSISIICDCTIILIACCPNGLLTSGKSSGQCGSLVSIVSHPDPQ